MSSAAFSRPIQGYIAHDNPLRPLPWHARPKHAPLLSDAILLAGLRGGLPVPAARTNQSENRASGLRGRRTTATSRLAPALRLRPTVAGVNFPSQFCR